MAKVNKRKPSKMMKRVFKRARRTLAKRKPQITRLRNNATFGLGLPMKATVTHRYAENITITSVAGVLAQYSFRANGLFDPNRSGTGHQPMYFDQFSALYDHYVVIGSKITVKFAPTTVTSTPVYVALLKNDDTGGPSAMTTVRESSQSTGVTLLAAGQSNARTLSQKWSAKKTFGGSVLANTELQGTPTTDPQEQTLFDIYVEGTTAANVSVICMVSIEYITVWKELKDIAAS